MRELPHPKCAPHVDPPSGWLDQIGDLRLGGSGGEQAERAEKQREDGQEKGEASAPADACQAGRGPAAAIVARTEDGTGWKRPVDARRPRAGHFMPLGRWAAGRWAAGPLGRPLAGRWAGRWALGRSAGPLGRRSALGARRSALGARRSALGARR